MIFAAFNGRRFSALNMSYIQNMLKNGCGLIFTVRRYALHGLSYRNSICPSVRLSVRHTRGLCPHGSTYDHDFFTIW